MNNETIIAIDPGKNGGFAIYDKGDIRTVKMPETPMDIFDELNNISKPAKCYLEIVHGMPGQSGPASFVFGKGYGWLEMALLTLGIPTETVTPQKWTKTLGLGTKSSCASPTEWKNKLKAKAQQLYPYINVTLWNADSLLILHYAQNSR